MTQLKSRYWKCSVSPELFYTTLTPFNLLFSVLHCPLCFLNSFLKFSVNSLLTMGKSPYLLKYICFQSDVKFLLDFQFEEDDIQTVLLFEYLLKITPKTKRNRNTHTHNTDKSSLQRAGEKCINKIDTSLYVRVNPLILKLINQVIKVYLFNVIKLKNEENNVINYYISSGEKKAKEEELKGSSIHYFFMASEWRIS